MTGGDELLPADILRIQDARDRNARFLEVLAGTAVAGEGLVWHDGQTPATWADGGRTRIRNNVDHRLTLIQLREEAAEARRVERDPCWRCGGRWDLHGRGCAEAGK